MFRSLNLFFVFVFSCARLSVFISCIFMIVRARLCLFEFSMSRCSFGSSPTSRIVSSACPRVSAVPIVSHVPTLILVEFALAPNRVSLSLAKAVFPLGPCVQEKCEMGGPRPMLIVKGEHDGLQTQCNQVRRPSQIGLTHHLRQRVQLV